MLSPQTRICSIEVGERVCHGHRSGPSKIMTRMTGGEAVVATLEANGARLAFGMPGIHNLAIYEALRKRPAFRHVLVRNEQGASIMANAAGRSTGRPGICVVTTGPAASNAVTGLADAARDSVPMLVVASQVHSRLIGQNKGAFHEILDQRGMFQAAGAWALRANRVEQIPAAVNAAWVAMTHSCPRPAYLEIPQDILFAEAEVEILPAPDAARPALAPRHQAEILRLIREAQRPLVYVGGGAAKSGSSDELLKLVERFSLPVFSTIQGKGVLPEDHSLSAGVMQVGNPACQALLSRADLMLALGTSFSEINTQSWSTRFPPRLIHVDIDGSQIARNVPAALGVTGDVRTVLVSLNAAAEGMESCPPSDWVGEVTGLREQIQAAVEGSPGAVLTQTLRRLLPRDAVLVGDAQGWGGWLIHHFPVFGPGQLLWPTHFGTLGYSVPGAIGVQAAFPGRPVVAACGDGGFLFCSNELATAAQHQLNIIVVLVNNAGYQSIGGVQEHRYGAKHAFGVDLVNPEFEAYARSLGCFARRVEDLDEFEPALAAALGSGQPAVVEITFQVPPP